jgi:uncharacterized protein YndB with AHSA1/START domain
MIEGDQVTVTVRVDVEPAVAFEVFTSEINLWWRRGVAYRVAGRRPGTLVMEGKVGGRLFEQYEGPDGPRTHQAGTVTLWEPPRRLSFEWRASNFEPGEVTFVDVTFTPTDSGATQLVLVHRGFASLRPDHPVRHNQPADVFIGRHGRWWGSLLSSLREHAAGRS